MPNRQRDPCGQTRLTVLLALVILLFFVVINFLTPVMGEDFVLNVIPWGASFQSIGHFVKSLATSIYVHMTDWNVRLGEQLSYIFSCLDKPLFNVLNALAALYFLWLVCRYAFKEKATGGATLYGLGVAFAAVLLFQPALGEIFFWRTGSTNYLWAMCVLLTFALPMRYYLSRESLDVISGSRLKQAGLTALGFFAGFTNENTVGAVVVLYAGVILLRRVKQKRLPSWVYTSFCSLLAGFIFMLKAPSTAYRMDFYNRTFGIHDSGVKVWLSRIPTVIRRFFADNLALVLLTLACLALAAFAMWRTKAPEERKASSPVQAHLEPLGWLLLTALSCGALILSPYIETRAFLFSDFMLVVCIVYYSHLALTCLGGKGLLCLTEAIILIGSMPCAVNVYTAYQEYDTFCTQRIAAVELSEKGPFIWGEYASKTSGRILTTREDYCRDQSANLSWYFQKNIQVVPLYIWGGNLRMEGYTQVEDHQGSIDWVDCDNESKVVTTGGWLALPGCPPPDTEIYTYLQAGDQLWYYATQKENRPDVAEALGKKDMVATGFRGEMRPMEGASEYGEITYGAVVIDRGAKQYCKVYGGTIALN